MRPIKFRAFDKEAKTMHKVSVIDFDMKQVMLEEDNGDYFHKSFDEIELMQFTGLHDKNGKEIYEGDILENLKERSVVYFEDGSFYVKFKDGRYRVGGFYRAVIEIIGNIHENPDLLK